MSRRALVIALIASLAINLFVLGGFAGAVLMGRLRPPGPPPLFGPPRLAAVGSALTPAHREAWESTVRQNAQSAWPKLRQARLLRRQAWQGLTGDPVNPQAALAGLDQARTLEFQARAEMDRAVVGFAATLPADERSKLGEALSRPRPHGPGGPGGKWSGGRPGPDDGPRPLPDR
jgi:uncharacterized membrane protein